MVYSTADVIVAEDQCCAPAKALHLLRVCESLRQQLLDLRANLAFYLTGKLVKFLLKLFSCHFVLRSESETERHPFAAQLDQLVDFEARLAVVYEDLCDLYANEKKLSVLCRQLERQHEDLHIIRRRLSVCRMRYGVRMMLRNRGDGVHGNDQDEVDDEVERLRRLCRQVESKKQLEHQLVEILNRHVQQQKKILPRMVTGDNESMVTSLGNELEQLGDELGDMAAGVMMDYMKPEDFSLLDEQTIVAMNNK